jgi:hypothetical protein
VRKASATIVVLAAVASAHDHRPPKTVLSIEEQRQQGRLRSSVWESRDGDYCVSQAIDGIPTFRRPLHAAEGSYRAKLRVRKSHKHRLFSLRAYTEFNRLGSPEGDGTPIPFELRRSPPEGEARAWVARFDLSLSKAEPRLLIDAFGRWRDLDGCGGGQTGNWTFSLRTP